MAEIDFSDESDSIISESLSIKEIILRQIRKIGDISSTEFTGGYWEKKPIKTGNGVMFSEVYHADVREAYCNAVDFLLDIVYPISDKKLKKYLKEFENFNDEVKSVKDFKEDEINIETRMKLKRQTFRQINIMFDNTDFFKGKLGYNE